MNLVIFYINTTLGPKEKIEKLKSIIIENDQSKQTIFKIDLMIEEMKFKSKRSEEEELLFYTNNILDHVVSLRIPFVELWIQTITNEVRENERLRPQTTYKSQFVKDFEDFEKQNISDVYIKLKNWKNYLTTKLSSESNYGDLKYVLNSKIYNTSFDEVEIPGYFQMKFSEPVQENRVFISRIESEYNFKLVCLPNKKIFIRGSNEKIYNFHVANNLSINAPKYENESKIMQIMSLFNSCFAINKDTYKRNVKIDIPIKVILTNQLRLIQEDTTQYFLHEIFEFCMQKYGFDPDLAFSMYFDKVTL